MQRIDPALPAWMYETYAIIAPRETHWREATCDEVACPNLTHGWMTRVREETDEQIRAGNVLGLRQAHYIRAVSGRKFVEHRAPDGFTEFIFEPGQQCFETHRVPNGRPEIYARRHGDWRGDPTGERPYVHSRPEHWVEDMGLNQQRLTDIVRRG